ncbi:hypothetical protein D3C86_1732860 [compost metagenome]
MDPASARELESRIGSQRRGVVAVFVARDDRIDALPNEIEDRMDHRTTAPFWNQGGQTSGEALPPVELCNQRDTAVAGQGLGVEPGDQVGGE